MQTATLKCTRVRRQSGWYTVTYYFILTSKILFNFLHTIFFIDTHSHVKTNHFTHQQKRSFLLCMDPEAEWPLLPVC